MSNSNNSRAGYVLHADLQNHAQRMAGAPDAVAVGEAPNISTMNYDADRIVGELVRQYLHCSNTTSGILCF